jgi:hypothetical protein
VSGDTDDRLEVISECIGLSRMADNLLAIHPHQVDVVTPQVLSGMCMVKCGVGVALPDSSLLAALLPVCSAGLECFLQLVLG